MKRGILAIAGDDAVLREKVAGAAGRSGLAVAHDGKRLRIFAGEAVPVRTMEQGAIVLGDIFSLSGATCQVPGDGWGNFLAFFEQGEAVRIERAALTGQPLYWCRAGEGLLLWSDLEVVETCLANLSIDWDVVAHSLIYANLRTARTGLAEVQELPSGSRLVFEGAAVALEMLWSPWEHIGSPRPEAMVDLAAGLERRIVGCTRHWSGTRPNILLELSGGLDSSIVAAALVAAGSDFAAITFVTPGADGDERHFARAVADCCGARLAELAHCDDAIDLVGRPAHLHARPAAYGVLGGIDAAFAAADPGDDAAIMGGIGGDNIFAFDTSVAPALDAIGQFGIGRRSFRTMRDVARAGDATIWEAVRLSWRSMRAGPAGWRRDGSFCNPAASPGAPMVHPWDAGECDAPRGKRNHVRALRRILDFVDRPGRWRGRDVVAPLLSQPVAEYCLSIPSWTWVSGGRDRAVARAAFARHLPPEIVWRRGKGRLDSLCAAAYLRQRSDLAALLLEGRLASQGLLDRPAIEACLARDLVEGDFDYFRLLEIADVERWVRSIEASPFVGPSSAQR